MGFHTKSLNDEKLDLTKPTIEFIYYDVFKFHGSENSISAIDKP